MWEMAVTSMTAFFRGRLFANNGRAYSQIALGAGTTALIFLAERKAGLSMLAAAPMAGFIGGALQPFLFKTLKYR